MKRLIPFVLLFGLTHAGLVLNQVPANGTDTTFTGTVTANKFVGDGSGLTNLPSGGSITLTGNINAANGSFSGKVTANAGIYSGGDVVVSGKLQLTKSLNNQSLLYATNTNAFAGIISYAGNTASNNYFEYTQYGQSFAGSEISGINRAGLSLLSSGADSSGILINTRTNSPINLAVNNLTALTISSNGNVGIGTTAPKSKTHINAGATDNAIILDNDGTGVNAYHIGRQQSAGVGLGFLRFYGDQNGYNGYVFGGINNPSGVLIDNIGNVGIGATAPSAKLDVVGTVSASALQVNGGSLRYSGGTTTVNNITTTNIVTIPNSDAGTIYIFTAARTQQDSLSQSCYGIIQTNGGVGNIVTGVNGANISIKMSGSDRIVSIYHNIGSSVPIYWSLIRLGN